MQTGTRTRTWPPAPGAPTPRGFDLPTRYNEISMATRGLFITFEGMDGSGKTTQMHRLAERLRALGRTVLETVEPGGPPIGHEDPPHPARFRQSGTQPHHRVAALLRLARAERGRVDPARAGRGEIVLSDRFTDSSLVYQGYGRGLGADTVAALDRIACRGLKPDLTLLVDVDAEASLARARARNAAKPHCETRMDDQSIEFHRRVYDAYHALAARRAGARQDGERPRRHRCHRARNLERS